MTAKIMVVEDEFIIAMDIIEDLQALGYVVPEIISSGEEAIAKAQEIQPDLILMDILLNGDIDGVTAAENIRQKINLPIVYLTSHTDPKTLERAKLTEPFGYIVKPFEQRELQSTIEMALTRHQAETKIREALVKEKELNDLKSRFITMVSHEFRTPMSTILFSAGLLEKYLCQWSNDKKLTHINRIQRSIEEMNNLLDDVLLIGKAEAGKLILNPIEMNLCKFCQEIAEEMQIIARTEQEIILVNECKNEYVYLDEKLLRHILTNLLSNAIKYSYKNSQIQFKVSCIQENLDSSGCDEVVVFQIKDQGIGIPVEDQERLFEAFHRAVNVDDIPGTGLGLTIVKKAVEAHGGKINLESELGVGTTFTVKIPNQKKL